jgi:MATE family multidrug resistance protein
MSLIRESRATLALAFPLMIGQLSQMLLGVTDSVMVGRLGVTELAALNFANSLFHIPFVFGIGMLTAVSVFTSNARGASSTVDAVLSCRNGLWLSSVLGILLFVASLPISYRLSVFGQPGEVAVATAGYFRILMASTIPALASIALKNHADALNRPWPPFWIFLGGVLLNIVLNWIMIFGNLGCPRLGLEGAAWATLASRTAILVVMILWLRNAAGIADWIPRNGWMMPCFSRMRSMLAVGFPASIHMLFEVSAFSVSGLFMGWIGTTAMAAHQITITLAATAFMIPLGLSMALTVRIGESWGAGDTPRCRTIVISGWLLSGCCGLAAALAFLLGGRWIASGFTPDAEVIRLTSALLVIVGIFQIFDSLQVASAAMLRGMHDTRAAAIFGFASYWLIGLPVGAWIAFGLQGGAEGVWWGLAAGLGIACVALGLRLWRFHSNGNSAAP